MPPTCNYVSDFCDLTPRQTGKPLRHLSYRQQYLLEKSLQGKSAGVPAKWNNRKVYRSKGANHCSAGDLHHLWPSAGAWRIYEQIPTAVRSGMCIGSAPQQTQDQLPHPPHIQWKKTTSRTWHQDCYQKRIFRRNRKKGTNQERNHRRERSNTKRLYRYQKGECLQKPFIHN